MDINDTHSPAGEWASRLAPARHVVLARGETARRDALPRATRNGMAHPDETRWCLQLRLIAVSSLRDEIGMATRRVADALIYLARHLPLYSGIIINSNSKFININYFIIRPIHPQHEWDLVLFYTICSFKYIFIIFVSLYDHIHFF